MEKQTGGGIPESHSMFFFFLTEQVLEESRLYSSVPQTNPCEYMSRLLTVFGAVVVWAVMLGVCGCIQNDLTGEHSCVMLKELNTDEVPELQSQWLSAFWRGERTRLFLRQLLSFKRCTSWPNSCCSLQISAGASCLSSLTSSAASTQVWRWTSCRIRSPRRSKAVRRPANLSTFSSSSSSHSPELTCLWLSQHSVAQSWRPFSLRTTWNAWSCTPGAWWTITSSWIWSQRWHASFSSSSSGTSRSQPHSV